MKISALTDVVSLAWSLLARTRWLSGASGLE